MRTFACARCDQLVFFENTQCLSCGAALGVRWADRVLVTLTDIGRVAFPLLAPEGTPELARCRERFGDDRADCGAALDRH